jgi:hypothetical protein
MGGVGGATVLGRFDVAARTRWTNAGRLWVSPEELRVAHGAGWAGDRVGRRDEGVEVRLGRRPLGPCVLWRPAGRRRWRHLCSYPSSTGAVAPRALARAGWIDLEGGPWPAPDVFFQCCRPHLLARRGWCVVGPDAISIETRRAVTVVARADVRTVRVVRQGRRAELQVLGPDPEPRLRCRSYAPDDLVTALAARGWPHEGPV